MCKRAPFWTRRFKKMSVQITVLRAKKSYVAVFGALGRKISFLIGIFTRLLCFLYFVCHSYDFNILRYLKRLCGETERVDSHVLEPSRVREIHSSEDCQQWSENEGSLLKITAMAGLQTSATVSWFGSHSLTNPTRWLVITILLSEWNSLGTSVECSQVLAGISPMVFKL